MTGRFGVVAVEVFYLRTSFYESGCRGAYFFLAISTHSIYNLCRLRVFDPTLSLLMLNSALFSNNDSINHPVIRHHYQASHQPRTPSFSSIVIFPNLPSKPNTLPRQKNFKPLNPPPDTGPSTYNVSLHAFVAARYYLKNGKKRREEKANFMKEVGFVSCKGRFISPVGGSGSALFPLADLDPVLMKVLLLMFSSPCFPFLTMYV